MQRANACKPKGATNAAGGRAELMPGGGRAELMPAGGRAGKQADFGARVIQQVFLSKSTFDYSNGVLDKFVQIDLMFDYVSSWTSRNISS